MVRKWQGYLTGSGLKWWSIYDLFICRLYWNIMAVIAARRHGPLILPLPPDLFVMVVLKYWYYRCVSSNTKKCNKNIMVLTFSPC